jgi:hypothetical protein
MLPSFAHYLADQCCRCSHKFHRIENYFSFLVLKKKIWANFQRIIELFTQKIVSKFSKIWVWDPRSGVRKNPIPDPGSRGQKGTGSWIRNTGLTKGHDNASIDDPPTPPPPHPQPIFLPTSFFFYIICGNLCCRLPAAGAHPGAAGGEHDDGDGRAHRLLLTQHPHRQVHQDQKGNAAFTRSQSALQSVDQNLE